MSCSLMERSLVLWRVLFNVSVANKINCVKKDILSRHWLKRAEKKAKLSFNTVYRYSILIFDENNSLQVFIVT